MSRPRNLVIRLVAVDGFLGARRHQSDPGARRRRLRRAIGRRRRRLVLVPELLELLKLGRLGKFCLELGVEEFLEGC